ncbi:MAG: ABC transporter substrate-binding protein [Nocardioidaceae bacterium]
MRRRLAPGLPLAAAIASLLAVACAPTEESTQPTPDTGGTDSTANACADPQTIQPDVLTIATDTPAFEPWFKGDDPTNAKGYESAVAYAVAKEMGFGADKVTWTKVPFNSSYQPGPKKFDFDINEISINAKRAGSVTFSDGYYSAAQAIITLKDSPYAHASSFADLKDAQLGAQVGTTSLDAITDTIQPSSQPRVFDDTNIAKNALQNGSVDGIVADLPTAFFITAVEIPQGTIVGQFQPETGQTEEFGLLFEKGNPLVGCANQAIATLKDDGTLGDIEDRWLSQVVDVPQLSP